MKPYRIAHVTSEITPYAKTGGLADISGALPPALSAAGHDVRVFTPLYASVDPDEYDLRPVEGLQDLTLRIGDRTHPFSVYETRPEGSEHIVYFIHCPTYYDRGGLYTNDPDEHARFVMLQRAALSCCQYLQWSPDVLHCHDWQTGLIPLYIKTIYAWDEIFANTRTVFTIHNLGYQGTFPASILGDTGLADCAKFLHQADLRDGRIGFLKTGLMYADLLTTVSPTYAEEIQTKEFGVGMDDLLRLRKNSLIGILNGVDTDVWDPATDPCLEHRYSAKSVWRKEKNKAALLQELGLGYQKGVPAFGMITRLTFQKGINLLREPLPEILEKNDMRLVVLGSGESDHEAFFSELQARFPAKVVFWQGFNADLAHRIEGGTDFFLMPSLYEPCGLNQMYSRIYGTVPIVRRTGGLADTVTLWDPQEQKGSGIVFDHATPQGVQWAIETALALYADEEAWKKLVEQTIDCDFSWDEPVRRYLEAYARVLNKVNAEVPG